MLDRFPIAGLGFLAAVLWFDLMFDALVLRAGPGVLSEDVLEPLTAYYAHVTVASMPMGRLVGVTIGLTFLAIVRQVVRGEMPRWATMTTLATLVLCGGGAMVRILPAAVRLSGRTDSIEKQTELARQIALDHAICFPLIVGAIVIQLWATRARPPSAPVDA